MRFLSFLASCAAAIALAADVPLARADEPGWTDQERLAERDVVCTATDLSVEKVGTIDERAVVGKDFRLFVDEYNLAIREHFKQSR